MAFSVKLTRDEYMNFCVKTRRKTVWLAALGIVLFLGAIAAYILADGAVHLNWLLMLVGTFCLTAEPLWLPMREKGAAGRRYDASDALQQATAVTLIGDTVTVRSACQEGTLPLAWMTEIKRTPAMVALVFGEELTVYIPRRAVNDDEWEKVCGLSASL